MTATLEDNVQLRETGSDAGPPRPFQLGSYPHLLRFPALRPASQGSGKGADIQGIKGRADAVIDAIIVPTIRSAEQLRSAVKLAGDARCQLVTLHSHRFPDGLASAWESLDETWLHRSHFAPVQRTTCSTSPKAYPRPYTLPVPSTSAGNATWACDRPRMRVASHALPR